MSAKLNIYNLGSLGVNVDSSPIHTQDGELSTAQNAIKDPLGSAGGIRKRPGLTKINASAAGSGTSVLGGTNFPQPFTVTNTFYAGIQATTPGGGTPATKWRTSTNGTTWANATTPTRAQTWDTTTGRGTGNQFIDNKGIITFRNKMYYAGDDYSVSAGDRPTIHVFDGELDTIAGYAPKNIATGGSSQPTISILAMAPYDKNNLLVTTDGGDNTSGDKRGSAFVFNPTTGSFTQVGPTAAATSSEFNAGLPWCTIAYLNRIWVGTERFGSGSGQVFFIRPNNDTVWTADATPGANYNIHSFAVYNGELYVGTRTLLGGSGKIFKRSTTGVYSTSLDLLNSSGGFTLTTGLTVFGSNLYAIVYNDDSGVATQSRVTIRKFDGTSWSIVWTLSDSVGAGATQHQPCMGLVGPDNALYFTLGEYDATATTDANSDGLIMRSTNGTSWTMVDQQTNFRGFIGYTVT